MERLQNDLLKIKDMKKIVFILLISFSANSQIINFTDANFKAKLMESSISESIATDINGDFVRIDANYDDEIDLDEAALISNLQVNFGNINSISGIENFINLTGLQCSNNNLTNLPISSLSQLSYLNCVENQITSLEDIQNLTGLTDIAISGNPITTIDLTNLNNLWRLSADETLLTEINLCRTAVRWLWCQNNPNLQALYLKNNVVSSDLARYNIQLPPPLHNFEFSNTPLLTYICYDDGEYDAVYHGLEQNVSNKTLTTSCDLNCSLSLEEVVFESNVVLYPNPTSDVINILISDNQSILKVLIYNLLGQKLISSKSDQVIDVSQLEKGIYLIEVETKNGMSTKRFIKN